MRAPLRLRERAREALDPDRALQGSMRALIESAGTRYALQSEPERWRPGQPLKLLLAGYVGTRNTGADVRVEEMIRQLRAIFGDDNLSLSLLTIDPERSAGYFRAVRQRHVPTVFPKFLYDECPKHHGVVACEGSMFKSKFATALSTMMAGALGMAAVEGKLAVGYGAEAGAMEASLEEFVADQCSRALVLCRNEPSRQVLERLDIRTGPGTDTAWTFEPAPPERGEALLREAGWDGRRDVLAFCPIHPFMWPTKPDLGKAFAWRFFGEFREQHYKSIYFHHHSAEATRKLERYLDGLAEALEAFVQERRVFPILVGMEALDRFACEGLCQRLSFRPPMFISDDYDMYDLVSVLRRCALLVSSRYHAVVTSMPGLVPSAGVTMDERIHNLMHDRGQPELLLGVEEDDLGGKLLEVLRSLDRERDAVRDAIARFLPSQLKAMGEMGIAFEDEAVRVYPELRPRSKPRHWEHYLPSLSPALRRVLEDGA